MQEELENVLEKVNYSPTHAGKLCHIKWKYEEHMQETSYMCHIKWKYEEHMQENFLHVSYKMEV